MKRLFFALWPDTAVRQQCFELVKAGAIPGQPVAFDNLHLTLVFLGNLEPDRQAALMTLADRLLVEPMTVCLDRLSLWQDCLVCCSRTDAIDPALARLAEQLKAAARGIGLQPDARRVIPHITLIRQVNRGLFAMTETAISPIVFNSRQFCLLESRFTEGTVKYQIVKVWR